MAELNYAIDHEDANENQFDPIPAGEYIAIIEDSDYVENKKGTGMMLKLTYQIIDGPMKGKKLFENLNLEHPNVQAVQIARRTLNAIGIACGVSHVADSAQLHNIPMKLDVRMKDSEEYGMQNIIRKHLPASGESTPTQAVNTPAQTQTAPSATGTGKGSKKHPWEKP